MNVLTRKKKSKECVLYVKKTPLTPTNQARSLLAHCPLYLFPLHIGHWRYSSVVKQACVYPMRSPWVHAVMNHSGFTE